MPLHKTANVLGKPPKRLQARAKEAIHEIWMADTRVAAGQAFDSFLATYGAKYLKAPPATKASTWSTIWQ